MYAARKEDLLLHPPLAAELFAMATEAVIYAAATAAVGAAIGFAIGATIGTCGAAGPLIPIVATALVGAASMIPVEEGKSIGDAVTGFSEGLADKLFPAQPCGRITSGSQDTWINGRMAARAAGISLGPASGPQPAQEEPSVLENVGAYAMLGASMLLPIIGLAQQIGDIFNPSITTPADPNTDTALLDTVNCDKHPPAPDQFIAQGSDKVFINGQPAAREGDKSTCDGKIGAQVSPNVRIGGGTLTVRDITDGKSALAKVTGLIVGLLLTRKMKFGCGVGNPVLPSSGSKYQAGPEDTDFSLPALVPLEWSRCYDSDDTRENGLFGKGWSVPFESEIVRVAHPEGGELWVHVDEQGTRMELGRLDVGTAFVSILDGRAFFHQEGGMTIVENIHSGQYQVFKTDPLDARRSRLVKIGDRNQNSLDLFYDEYGRLLYLGDLHGRSFIALNYAGPHTRRVDSIERLYLRKGADFAIESREALVSYRYTDHCQLQAVLTPQGQLLRQFTYTDSGHLASHVLPGGSVRHYQWARFTTPAQGPACVSLDGTPYTLAPLIEPQPEDHWRVVRHWGSDGEDYHFAYDLEQGHTQVTDGLGREEHYYWGPLQEIHTHIDALGQCWRQDFVAGQLRRTLDPTGREWQFGYDRLGRLTSTCDPLGRVESTRYMEHWALPLSITDGAGRTRRFGYDRHGNLLHETDPLGRQTRYRHDGHGRLTEVIDPQGRQRELTWNERSQVTGYRDCSANLTRFAYDRRGYLSDMRSARGEHTRYSHDSQGLRLQTTTADGQTERFEYDLAGQLTGYFSSDERSSHWQYDGSGRLLQRTDPLGNSVRLAWDAYDRLRHVENENGETTRFEWDALDRLTARQDPDGGGHSYQYDASGNIVEACQHPARDAAPPPSPGQATRLLQRFDYDSAARLVRKHTDDGVTAYSHDPADNLLSVSFTDRQGATRQLAFTYDALDQLRSESCGAGELQYAYDDLGNLQTLTLPDSRRINQLYYGAGHLHQINLDSRVICDFERDEVHEEVLRTQGMLQTHKRYDSLGRLSGKTVQYRDASNATLPLLHQALQYDTSGRLVGVLSTQTQRTGNEPTDQPEDIIGRFHGNAHGLGSHQASINYHYGPTERIHGATRQLPGQRPQIVEHYGYDRAGNLLDDFQVRGHVRHNRVTTYRDRRLRYDGFGRLVEKRVGNRLLQQFEYDAESRLVCVHQSRGTLQERIEFSYDPLGRRTRKSLYRHGHDVPVSHTEFLWQGLRLLQEIQDGRASLYLYEDTESHTPLARIDGPPGQEQVHYFHTNLVGLPEQLTDVSGTSVWHGQFEVWGNSQDEWHAPSQAQQQNLRFPGQYLDRETGLHYNLFRYFDPDLGRFTQPDPIGLIGGLNTYRYAPNPIDWMDPLGLKLCGKGSGGRGLGGHTRLDRAAAELDTAVQRAARYIDRGGHMGTPWGKLHQKWANNPHVPQWLKNVSRGNAIQQITDKMTRNNRYLREIKLQRNVTGRWGKLRPDYHANMKNGKVAVFDITTPGQAPKIGKYDIPGATDWMINITY